MVGGTVQFERQLIEKTRRDKGVVGIFLARAIIGVSDDGERCLRTVCSRLRTCD